MSPLNMVIVNIVMSVYQRVGTFIILIATVAGMCQKASEAAMVGESSASLTYSNGLLPSFWFIYRINLIHPESF